MFSIVCDKCKLKIEDRRPILVMVCENPNMPYYTDGSISDKYHLCNECYRSWLVPEFRPTV